ICCKGIEDHFLHTGFGPSYQPFVNPRPFFVRFWQYTPRCTLASNPHHGIDTFPVIDCQYVLNPLLSQENFLLFLPIGRLVSLEILSPLVTKRLNLTTS
ncbi:hypothetical protein, partial [Holospora curviuscula]|uniref:hypothetical protein n=1 Tax=Holospora curviuscula TaxID=1082868 RepID=UPI001FB00800